MFERLLADLARALDAAGIPYMVIGGQAVLLYGEPRLTRDVDLTLGIGPDRLADVLRAAEQMGLVPLVEPEPFVMETLVLPCEAPDSGLRVDFIFALSDYEREAMARVRRVELGGVGVRFASVEDLLVHKVVAGRPRDLEDARGVLVRNAGVDAGYVRRWLSTFEDALDQPLLDVFDALYRETR
jgi:predicted nucleotidyltransferase